MMMIGVMFTLLSCHHNGNQENESANTKTVQADAEINYLPFQTKLDGKWGLIGTDGQVLFADSMKHEPSVAVNGMFTVKNSRGLYEYYTAEASPKKVGGEYTQAGLFWEDIAPCKESGKSYIEYIRKDGTVAFQLDSKVSWVGRFSNGLAPFKQDRRYGYMDKQGKVVIAPKLLDASAFSEGYALVVTADSDNVSLYNSKGNYVIRVMDATGKLMKTAYHKADSIGKAFHAGLLRRNTQMNDTTMVCGFMDVHGRMLIPGKSTYKRVSDMFGTHFAFNNGLLWGIADNQLSTILEPKYDDVIAITDDYVAVKQYGYYKLLDFGGEQKSKSYTYMKAVNGGKCYIAERGGVYHLLDADGNEIGKSYPKITFPNEK